MSGLLRELGVRDPQAAADRLVALADGLGVRVLTGDLATERALALLDAELASVAPADSQPDYA